MGTDWISSSWTRFLVNFPQRQHRFKFTSQYHRVVESPSPSPSINSSDDDDEEKQFALADHDYTRLSTSSGATIISFFLGFAIAITISALSVYLHETGPLVSQQSPFSPETKQTLSRENWSGAVYKPPPAGSRRFAATKASFFLPDNNSSTRIWSAWVGLDASAAAQDNSPFLRMGVDIRGMQFAAWYQWYPEAAQEIQFVFRPGDLIAIEAVMFNSTSGKVVIRNESRRSIMQQFLDMPQDKGAQLQGYSAEWGVEVQNMDSGIGSVVLGNCVAYTDSGGMVVAEQGEVVHGAMAEITAVNGSIAGQVTPSKR